MLGLAATRSDESTLGIFADSTTSNITTNSAFVGSFALDFGEKLKLGDGTFSRGPLYSNFGKKIVILTLPVNKYSYIFLVLCMRELFVGGKIFLEYLYDLL